MRTTFAPLRGANYRRYFIGQALSLVGTYMHVVATGWLVLSLSHSGAVLGALMAVQLVPWLVLGAYAGVIIDRVDKRKLVFFGNAVDGLLCALLAVLCLTHSITLPLVFAFGFTLGLSAAFTVPAQQAFVSEMVATAELKTAVTLTNMMGSVARVVGPACAGLLIANASIGYCFALNAASYLAVLTALARMRAGALDTPEPTARGRRQVREGLRYAWSRSELLVPLLMMAVIGTFAYEFQVSLPLMAKGSFHGGATAYGLMTGAMGVGALLGGVFINHRLGLGVPWLTRLSLAFAATISLAAAAPSLATELAALVLVGALSAAFMATVSSTLQLGSVPQMRGRVMALWGLAVMGSTAIGAPVIGAVAGADSPRAGLAIGAIACALCAAGGWSAHRRRARSPGAAAFDIAS
jgi:MFS family permease